MPQKIAKPSRFLFFITSVALFVLFAASSLAASDSKPNIVLILADDLGWRGLSCYGSDYHETPHLDALAQEGMRFTDAYSASPVCSPTRASILTGKHPARLNMTIWRESAKNRGKKKLLEPVALDSLPPSETTFPELLKEVGYYNIHIGKWHVGDATGYPQVHGFHRNIGGTLWGAPQSFWYPYNGDSYFSDWRYVPDLEPGQKGDYLTDVLTDKALEAIEEQAATDEPFFLNLWYHSVHTPIEGKPELVERYERKLRPHHKQRNPHYAAMIHSLDENVGRVLDAIDRLGLSENTLVIFTSDNGGFINPAKLHPDLPIANNQPLRSGKGSAYEGGIRVPFIARGPKVAKGTTSDSPIISCDLFFTLLDVAGIPNASKYATDGVSLSALLADPSTKLERDSLSFHYPHYYRTTTPVTAIRKGDWKLLEYYEDGRLELYNLARDLSETKDLSKTRPEIAQRIRAELHAWKSDVDASEPELNPNH